MSTVAPNVTALVYMSVDPHTVSNDDAQWFPLTDRLIEMPAWRDGTNTDLDPPQPGDATFVFDNSDRYLEERYSRGPWYGKLGKGVRFRLIFCDADSGLMVEKGVWFARRWGVAQYEVAYGEIAIECGCGLTVMEDNQLETLDPVEASSYSDVVAFDEPWGYYRLGEAAGTKLVSQVRVSKKGRGKKRRTVRRRVFHEETLAEAAGVAGPSGTYKNTPLLEQEGVLLGDTDTAVWFRNAQGEYATITVDFDDLNGSNVLTVEAWVQAKSANAGGTIRYIVASPNASAGGPAWRLGHVNNEYYFLLLHSAGSLELHGPTPTVDAWEHVVVTWNGVTASMYVDNVLVTSDSDGAVTMSAATNGALTISGASTSAFDGLIDEVALYESVLSPERIAAHYISGTARGFPAQTAGERIAELADSTLWDASGIVASSHTLLPAMKAGQSRVEEIREAVACEAPTARFAMGDDGHPRYLPWNYRADPPYDTVQAYFGDLSAQEVGYESLEQVVDEEYANEVIVSHVGDVPHVSSDDAAIAARGPSTNTELQGLQLRDHPDAEAVADATLAVLSEEVDRVRSITLSGTNRQARRELLLRQIGDVVRIRRRGPGQQPIDIITTIVGRELTLDRNLELTGTLRVARGFDASVPVWRLGLTGYSELDASTVLA